MGDAEVSSDAIGPLTAAQSRAVDRYAVDVLGLPGLVLMENAAINTASVVLDLLEDAGELDRDAFVVSVLCGGGNNGGDGYAIARQLMGFGVAVKLYALKPVDELRDDAAVNAKACAKLGLEIVACANADDAERHAASWASSHVLVDALLGTGFSGELREGLAGVIAALNRTKTQRGAKLRVVSVDVPSGLNADTGKPAEPTVRADVTVTFVAPKTGFATTDAAQAHLGRVIVADIGLPDAAVRAALAADGNARA